MATDLEIRLGANQTAVKLQLQPQGTFKDLALSLIQGENFVVTNFDERSLVETLKRLEHFRMSDVDKVLEEYPQLDEIYRARVDELVRNPTLVQQQKNYQGVGFSWIKTEIKSQAQQEPNLRDRIVNSYHAWSLALSGNGHNHHPTEEIVTMLDNPHNVYEFITTNNLNQGMIVIGSTLDDRPLSNDKIIFEVYKLTEKLAKKRFSEYVKSL